MTLSQAVNYSVSVFYQTVNGSATYGTNYTATSGTLTYSPGDTSKTFTVQTELDPNATGDSNFSVTLGTPSASGGGPSVINGAGSTGTGFIEKVCGSLTIYNPDGTASDDGTVDVGDSVPMMVRLTSPAAVDGQFMVSYDTSCFKITTDAAGNNVVKPDTTTFTASTGGTQLYSLGAAATEDSSGSQIQLFCVAGNSQTKPVANQNVHVDSPEQDDFEKLHNIDPDSRLTENQKMILAAAKATLSNSGLSQAQQNVRIEVLEAVMTSLVGLPAGGEVGTRNPKYWTNPAGNESDHYVVRVGVTAERAIDDMWDGIYTSRIWCRKYSAIIMVEGLYRYFQGEGNQAGQAGIKALDKILRTTTIGDGLNGKLWTVKDAAMRTGYTVADLQPGDQIWFKNTYYYAGKELIYQQAWQEYMSQGMDSFTATRKAETYAAKETTGEEGSNVFYLGLGQPGTKDSSG